MSTFLSRLLIVSNATDECENVSRSNAEHLNGIPGLRAYKAAMVILPAMNFVLNVVCFVVFRSLSRRSGNDFHRILTCLAGSDALFQLEFAWLNLLLYLMDINLLRLPSLAAALLVAGCMSATMYSVTVLHLMRNWLVVLISYYRHRTTSGPRSGKGCLLSKPVWPKAAGFVAACFLVALPRCFEFSVITCAPRLQVTHIAGHLNERLAYRVAYQGIVLFLAQSAGPFILLAYFSVVLCLRVRRQEATRRSLTSSAAPVDRGHEVSRTEPHQHHHPQQQQQQQQQHHHHNHQSASCTRMVALLCTAFLLCEAATMAKVVDTMRHRLQLLGYIANFLVCVDSTLNCLIYSFTNRQFSEALRRRFRCCSSNAGNRRATAAGAAEPMELYHRRRLAATTAAVPAGETGIAVAVHPTARSEL